MKTKVRENLMKRHSNCQVFDFRREIVQYCVANEEILTLFWLKFRQYAIQLLVWKKYLSR